MHFQKVLQMKISTTSFTKKKKSNTTMGLLMLLNMQIKKE